MGGMVCERMPKTSVSVSQCEVGLFVLRSDPPVGKYSCYVRAWWECRFGEARPVQGVMAERCNGEWNDTSYGGETWWLSGPWLLEDGDEEPISNHVMMAGPSDTASQGGDAK